MDKLPPEESTEEQIEEKPKGILKTSASFEKTGEGQEKTATFDELNVLQTYHPADKDYGFMNIDEPKTPYYDPANPPEQLDPNVLAERLRIAANTQTASFGDDELSDDEFPETEDEKVRRLEFERRRKKHYNEFEAINNARKLINDEMEDLEDDDDDFKEYNVEKTESYAPSRSENQSITPSKTSFNEYELEEDYASTVTSRFDVVSVVSTKSKCSLAKTESVATTNIPTSATSVHSVDSK